MKTIFRNCTVLFKKKYPAGTKLPITPNYSGQYGVGKGYYLSEDSYPPVFSEDYVGMGTGVSEPIPTEGYTKISLVNGKYGYHSVVGFLNSNGLIIGRNYKFQTSDGAVVNANGNYDLTLDIPSDAVSVVLAKNTTGGGNLAGEYKAYFIV